MVHYRACRSWIPFCTLSAAVCCPWGSRFGPTCTWHVLWVRGPLARNALQNKRDGTNGRPSLRRRDLGCRHAGFPPGWWGRRSRDRRTPCTLSGWTGLDDDRLLRHVLERDSPLAGERALLSSFLCERSALSRSCGRLQEFSWHQRRHRAHDRRWNDGPSREAYVSKPTEALKGRLEAAQAARLFVVQAPGPTSFVLREEGSREKKIRVSIGSVHMHVWGTRAAVRACGIRASPDLSPLPPTHCAGSRRSSIESWSLLWRSVRAASR